MLMFSRTTPPCVKKSFVSARHGNKTTSTEYCLSETERRTFAGALLAVPALRCAGIQSLTPVQYGQVPDQGTVGVEIV